MTVSRVGVAGGSGLVGRHVVEALRRGHEAVACRGRGVDLETGEGLADALRGMAVVGCHQHARGRPG